MQTRFFCAAALALLACSQQPTQSAPTVAATPVAAAFPETFEAGSKGAYTEADEPLATGPWHFANALVGSAAQDHKNGLHAARLRAGGRLTMRFDAPAGVRRIRILAAAYGTDAPSTWELWLSRDQGRSWQRTGQPQTAAGPQLRPAEFAGLTNEPLRLEIRKTDPGPGRLNLDDIALETASGPATAVPGSANGTNAAGSNGVAGGYFENRNTQPTTRPAQPATRNPQPDEEADNLLLGNPSGATSDPANATNYLLVRPEFTTGYNAQRGTPTWTCWHVGPADLSHAAPRQNDFRPDPALPRQFYAVTPKSYARSGFDKGHNCPSADRSSSLDANSATFLMSNMVPQAPHNNQQTWAHLEEYTRTQVDAGQEAYVLMGCYGRGGTGSAGPVQTLDEGRVTVPARIWKVVVFLPNGPDDLQRIAAGQGRIVAIDTPNDNALSPDWKQYLTTINTIEAATGLDLLSALPSAVQARLSK